MRWTQEQLNSHLARSKSVLPASTPATSAAPKRAKFLNVKTTDLEGIVHDGKGEAQRWQELRLRERAGDISQLRRQVPFALVVNGILVATYIADFVWREGEATVVEDHKSPRTRKLRDFRMKVKLMAALHGLQVHEVTK